MPIHTPPRLAALVLLAAALGGCATNTGRAQASGAAAANVATTSDALAQTTWELVRWTLPDGAVRALPDAGNGEPIRLVFHAQKREYRVSGFAGCNRYMGSYKLAGGKLVITTPASSRMACASPQRQQLEAAYLRALARIETFTLDSGGAPRHMTFNVQGGEVLDFTRRQDPPSTP